MNIASAAFFVIVVVFAWRGYLKGFAGSIAGVVGWVSAYAAAIFFTKSFAAWLVERTTLDGLLVYFVAGSLIFFAVSTTLNLGIKLLGRLRRNDDADASAGAKLGGAAVGLVVGSIVGLFAVYAIGLVRGPAPMRITPDQWTPVTERALYGGSSLDYFLETSAKDILGAAATTAIAMTLDDEASTRLVEAFVENPKEMVGHAQQVMANNERMSALMGNEAFQMSVRTGDVQAVMNTPDFKALAEDEHVQALLAQSGEPGKANTQQVAETLVSVMGRANQFKDDPRVTAILNDPEFQQQLNSSDKLALMMDPRIKQLADIIFSGASGSQR